MSRLIIGRDNFQSITQSLTRQVIVISDDTVAQHYQACVNHALSSHVLHWLTCPPGESAKSFETYQSFMQSLIDIGIGRDATLIALGGGVVGDIAGFVASTYMRGIRLIQIPTTLLSQVDSSVGGKTAINVAGTKNIVGSFYPAHTVLINIDTLSTLPAREFACGMAEVIKAAMIDGDDFFSWIEQHIDKIKAQQPDSLIQMIQRAVAIKQSIVERDPLEQTGERMLLNLGHTLAHAIEAESQYQILHGEAVAIGLVHACRQDALRSRVERLLKAFDLPVVNPYSLDILTPHMRRDKKNRDGKIVDLVLSELGGVEVGA